MEKPLCCCCCCGDDNFRRLRTTNFRLGPGNFMGCLISFYGDNDMYLPNVSFPPSEFKTLQTWPMQNAKIAQFHFSLPPNARASRSHPTLTFCRRISHVQQQQILYLPCCCYCFHYIHFAPPHFSFNYRSIHGSTSSLQLPRLKKQASAILGCTLPGVLPKGGRRESSRPVSYAWQSSPPLCPREREIPLLTASL